MFENNNNNNLPNIGMPGLLWLTRSLVLKVGSGNPQGFLREFHGVPIKGPSGWFQSDANTELKVHMNGHQVRSFPSAVSRNYFSQCKRMFFFDKLQTLFSYLNKHCHKYYMLPVASLSLLSIIMICVLVNYGPIYFKTDD